MRKTKKPAIASEWREDKEAEERAREEAKREARREFRRRLGAGLVRLVQALVLRLGWMAALIAGCLTAAALLSYTPSDAGFSVTGNKVPANLCGLWGAWTSDALYWALGIAAWWVPVSLLVYGGVWLHRSLTGSVNAVMRPVTSAAGQLLLAAATSGLAVIELSYLGKHLPMGSGGLVGNAVAANTAPFLGIWGSTFVLSAAVLAGLSLAFHFSWLTAAEKTGAALEGGVELLKAGLERLKKRTAATPSDAVTDTEPAAVESPEATEPPAWTTPEEAVPAEPETTPSAETVSPAPVRAAAAAEKPAAGGKIRPQGVLLDRPPTDRAGVRADTLQMTSRLIESKLQTYKINAHVADAKVGPVITQYLLDLAPGVKSAKVEEVKRDLARALAVNSVRLVSSVPGTTYMGLEIPNQVQQRQAVYLSEVIGSDVYEASTSPLTLALGKDIGGNPVVTDLAKLPHLLVGGTTGSGKSVAINAMILSLLYKSGPDDLRLVLIDPKTVEFTPYKDIPHLLCPVVTDMNKAANALNWLVQEMDRRYNLMSRLGVRSFLSFNDKVKSAAAAGTPLTNPFKVTEANEPANEPLKPFPYIVCFIDELADLILVNKKQVEMLIVRLAQKARAAGIHLVLATQRPSVDIVTPLIKANIAARACFQVSGRFDSQVVLDETGAQDLLGHGDMLFRRPGTQMVTRLQGCMVSEAEVERVVEDLKSQGAPDYIDAVTESDVSDEGAAPGQGGLTNAGEKDPLYDQAVQLVIRDCRASSSYVQRNFGIGYNRAANLIESMERAGIVSKPNAAGKREVLVKASGGLE